MILSLLVGLLMLTPGSLYAHQLLPTQLILPLEDFYQATLIDVGLGRQSANHLQKVNIYTLGDLMNVRSAMTAKRFQCFLLRALGEKALRKVLEIVNKYLPKEEKTFIEGSLELFCMSERAVLALAPENIRTADDLYRRRQSFDDEGFARWLMSLPGIGPNTGREIELFLKKRSEIWECRQLLFDLE